MKEISKQIPQWSDGRQMTQEEYEKLIIARDSILAFMLTKDFNMEEAFMTLEMCKKELDSAVNRSNLSEIRKEEEYGKDYQ